MNKLFFFLILLLLSSSKLLANTTVCGNEKIGSSLETFQKNDQAVQISEDGKSVSFDSAQSIRVSLEIGGRSFPEIRAGIKNPITYGSCNYYLKEDLTHEGSLPYFKVSDFKVRMHVKPIVQNEIIENNFSVKIYPVDHPVFSYIGCGFLKRKVTPDSYREYSKKENGFHFAELTVIETRSLLEKILSQEMLLTLKHDAEPTSCIEKELK